jgi:hypothetical protein
MFIDMFSDLMKTENKLEFNLVTQDYCEKIMNTSK